MMVKRFVLVLLLLGFVPAGRLAAQQPTDAERKVFEQTKAKAEKGDLEAEFLLGTYYASGIGVAPNPSRAFKWHRKAAEQGYARAQYQVALEYASGIGVKVDLIEGARWLQRAAEQGLVEAQLDLGQAYLRGEGVEANAAEAARWFRKAADQGLRHGIYQLGKCYLEGTGVTKDIEEGVKLVRQAADMGYPPAQNRLAQSYEKGVGVGKDWVEAYKWYNLAAAQDDELALDIRVSLAKLEATLTPEQVAQAQKLAREFKVVTNATPTPTPDKNKETVAGDSPAIGLVNVRAQDDTCEIFVDGSFVGNSPARLKLREGPHVIEVKKAGFNDYRREVKVSSGSELSLNAALEKK